MKTQRGVSVLAALASVLMVACLVAAAIGAWKLGWFVEEKNTDQKVRIINHNSGTQTAWMDEVQKTIIVYNHSHFCLRSPYRPSNG